MLEAFKRASAKLQTDLIHKGVQNTVQPFVFLRTKFSTKFETGFGT
eukprot:SAG11_NODE_22164_length_411_cov_0.653846_1_plen_45_part_01